MMQSATIFLPWPDRKLSPNARVHWATLASERKKAKAHAFYIVRSDGVGIIDADAITVGVSFYPPDRRPRDIDNCISSCKAAFDGIAQAIGIDDSQWKFGPPTIGPVEKYGLVKVVLEWEQKARAA